MRVTLNIGEDQKLRAAVRQMIEGQVNAIVREEFPKLINEVVAAEVKRRAHDTVDRLITNEFRRSIDSTIRDRTAGKELTDFIRKLVGELFVDRFGARKDET